MPNRLVAAELERRWEAALVEQRQAEESLERFRQQQRLISLRAAKCCLPGYNVTVIVIH